MDETSQKIIDAAMTLIRDQGYVATTTKDIARTAGVNECTLFRRFQNKKDIVMQGIAQEKWRANVTPEIFREVQWELRADLEMFLAAYMERITPDFVRLSIGLRASQLYGDTAPLIMQIPQAFLASLTEYLEEMGKRGKIAPADFESMAMVIFSSTFGFTFLKASFNQELTKLEQKEYIKKSVDLFIRGISV